ncbi:glutaminase [Luteimonas sp. M1R5S18]|uniref:Glutaminase n=1 Tax=Luteimonas rhizosphaericola TaxID=3042024 RepID=A0ABT6JEU7_9GAMM|nr:glutaminase [Luteimonas rhizosphaericola]MDH5829208.1 glutaminase [Luteimonas rhizosphaericola]
MRKPPQNPHDLSRHDLDDILGTINEDVRQRFGEGKLPDYIPSLAEVPKDRFGMALALPDGKIHAVGNARERFSIQSVSKVYTLTLALSAVGDELWKRVDREPSGDPFNSLVQLEYEKGIPRNPFMNAGALVTADVVLSSYDDAEATLIGFMRTRSGNPEIGSDEVVAKSERESGHRNVAMANFIRSYGNLENSVDDVLAFYYLQCSLRMDCVDLARSVQYLADAGHCATSGVQVTSAEGATRINSVMMTAGTYDAAGDFAYYVGLPAKSGVGGGIVAVVPHVMGICVWSPGLDDKGNSLLGRYALHRFTRMTGLSVF